MPPRVGSRRDGHGEVRDPLPRPETCQGKRLRQDRAAIPHESKLNWGQFHQSIVAKVQAYEHDRKGVNVFGILL